MHPKNVHQFPLKTRGTGGHTSRGNLPQLPQEPSYEDPSQAGIGVLERCSLDLESPIEEQDPQASPANGCSG